MSSDARIPVSKDLHRELHMMKEPGQTYDELLSELVRQHKKRKLMDRLDEIEETTSFAPLEDIVDEDADGESADDEVAAGGDA